jgi:hypothetical protein
MSEASVDATDQVSWGGYTHDAETDTAVSTADSNHVSDAHDETDQVSWDGYTCDTEADTVVSVVSGAYEQVPTAVTVGHRCDDRLCVISTMMMICTLLFCMFIFYVCL